MDEYKQIFMNTLARLRREKDCSQQDIALYAGLNKSTISKYEKGVIFPTLDVAKKIADYFGVSVDYLVNPVENKDEKITEKSLGEIAGLSKDYIKAIKIAASKDVTPDELIGMIDFAVKLRK